MHIRKFLAVLALVAMAVAGTQGSAVTAASLAGTKCTVKGKTTISAGKTYVCTVSGKTKVWKLKTSAAPKPTPTPVSTVSPMPGLTGTYLAGFNQCTLPVADNRGDVALGLPRIYNRGKDVGTVNATVIFVDFPDVKATMSPEMAFDKISPRSSQIFSEVSYGKLNYVLNPNFHWFTMSKPSTSYSFATFDGQHSYVGEAIALADPTTDFSKTDSLIILSNPAQSALGNGPAITYRPNDGFWADGSNIHNGATSGADLNFWGGIWLNHEIGHSFGLVDLYSALWDTSNYDTVFKYTGNFSFMGYSSEQSNAPSLFAWERYVLGWLDDNQMMCAPDASGTYALTPVESAGGTKALVIPINTTTNLVVESRKAIGIDSKLAKPGLLVYRVDTSLTSGYGPIQVLTNSNLVDDPRYLKAPLAMGESVTFGKYTITASWSSATGDVVSVTHN
ncbi:MAG: hypothetical protein RLZZ164_187 [Actinomycetota bacterium]